MPDAAAVPVASAAVRRLLRELLGLDVVVEPGEPLQTEDLPATAVALYVDDRQQLTAVVGMDLPLAAYAAAAMAVMPVRVAQQSIAAESLDHTLAENLTELCNVLSTLLNREGAPHVRLHEVLAPGDELPGDAAAQLLALGRRLDLIVEVARYGAGRFALSLPL